MILVEDLHRVPQQVEADQTFSLRVRLQVPGIGQVHIFHRVRVVGEVYRRPLTPAHAVDKYVVEDPQQPGPTVRHRFEIR